VPVTKGIAAATLFLKGLMGVSYIGDCIGKALQKQGAVERMAVAPDCKVALEHGVKDCPETRKYTDNLPLPVIDGSTVNTKM